MLFTPSLFFQYATCPHWIWHDRFSDPKGKGELPELAIKLMEQGVLHEEEYVKDLELSSVGSQNPEEAKAQTLSLMRSGAKLIYQGEIETVLGGIIFRGRPDLLEKVPGISAFGDYHYIPVDIKSSKEANNEQIMQLTLYGMILEQIQRVYPQGLAIINRDKERKAVQITEKTKEKTKSRTEMIISVMKGNKPPLKLVKSCLDSPWSKKCISEAEAVQDIALIYHMDSRSYPKLRENGINTIVDIAHADLSRLPKIPFLPSHELQRCQIQAQSLIDKEMKWLEKPKFRTSDLKIFFDIEADPLLNIDYLFGFWMNGDSEEKYAKIGKINRYAEKERYFLYFLAERPEDEEKMWNDFLGWIDLLPSEYAVYHYHHYEMTHLKALAKKYEGSANLEIFLAHCIDLRPVVSKSVILPLYFYSIKDIAKSKFLNFKWRHGKAGGAQSIFWYEEWLEKGDRAILQDILDYNEDDVRATECLYNWLVSFM